MSGTKHKKMRQQFRRHYRDNMKSGQEIFEQAIRKRSKWFPIHFWIFGLRFYFTPEVVQAFKSQHREQKRLRKAAKRRGVLPTLARKWYNKLYGLLQKTF